MPKGQHRYHPTQSGGGSGLGALLGALYGAPAIEGGDMLSGDEIASQYGPEAAISSGAYQPTPRSVKQPGFWQNLLTKGQAGQQAADLTNTIKMGEYNNILQQQLLKQRMSGARGLEAFRQQGQMSEAEFKSREAEKLAAANSERNINEKRMGEIFTRGFSTPEQFDANVVPYSTAKFQGDTFKQNLDNANIRQNPEQYIQSQDSLMAKQGFENASIGAKTQETLAGVPTKRFLDVREGGAMVDPATGQSIQNFAPQKETPEVKGGVVSSTLPQYSGGSFAKVPGGVNSEFSRGGVPPMLARPATQAPFVPTPVVNQEPSLTNPTFDSKRFQEDFSGLMQIPIIQDYLQKRGMFKKTIPQY